MRTDIRYSLLGAAGVCALLAATPVSAQWMGPEAVAGVGSTDPPGAATGGPHAIDIVLTGPNRHLYWQWPTAPGVYPIPTDLSDVGATSSPALVANGRHKLDAFYRGKNGHLWTSWWDGTWWSAPTDLGGGGLKYAPVAAQGGPHRLDVFYVDTLNRLHNSYWDGGPYWSGAGTFNVAGVKGPVAVVTTGPHKVEIFYRSTDNRLWHFWSDGGPWSAPVNMEMDKNLVITSSPSGASLLNPARTYASLFFRDNSGNLCVYESLSRQPWSKECTGIKVSDRIAAITVDEVFAMGLTSSSGTLSNATTRIWRK